MEDSKIRTAIEQAKECKHDFTQLVADALKNCKPYRKLDWAQIRSWDDIAKYSISDSEKDILEENDVDVFEKYCTNKDEVNKAEDTARLAVLSHLKSCDVQSCKNLHNARVDLEVDGYDKTK